MQIIAAGLRESNEVLNAQTATPVNRRTAVRIVSERECGGMSHGGTMRKNLVATAASALLATALAGCGIQDVDPEAGDVPGERIAESFSARRTAPRHREWIRQLPLPICSLHRRSHGPAPCVATERPHPQEVL